MTHNKLIAAPGDAEVDDLDEVDEVLETTFSITSFGADYPVDGLVKRLDNGDIVVPLFNMEPEAGQTTVGFQRDFVWKKPQADRFIESLLLGLPVPSIFLVKEPNGKFLVLDGQQRLKTLQSFYAGVFRGSEFALNDVQPMWLGKTYRTLDAEDRRRLDNSILHAIIVRQDSPTEDQSSIYLIFERLNSGGTMLQPQEIRVALYHGSFVALLSKLNENTDWRGLYGSKNSRLKDIELIVRFFALYFHHGSYRRPMKAFLNRFMASNRDMQFHPERELTDLFETTTATILRTIGARAFRPFGPNINTAVLDSIMYGVAARLAHRQAAPSAGNMVAAYNRLIIDDNYRKSTTKSTADEESVRTRLDAARVAFADVS